MDNLDKFKGYVLEKKSPIPLYFQVEKIIHEKIHSGDLKPGDKLPTELEFIKKFQVSRPTIRQAIANLVRSGFLDIKKGYGTFIKSRGFEEPVLGIRSFSDEAIKQGFNPKTIILKFITLKPTDEIINTLKINKEDKIFEIKRLRLLDSEPVAIDTTYIPVKVAPDLSKKDFEEEGKEQSLYYILKFKYGLVLNSGEETVDATVVFKEEADLLAMENKSPINLRKRVIYSDKNEVILYMKSIYKTRYRIKLEGPF